MFLDIKAEFDHTQRKTKILENFEDFKKSMVSII